MWRLKPELWPCYPRYLRQRWRRSGPVLHGMVYIGRGVRLLAKRHYGRLVLGKAVRIGDHTALRAHEGSLVIADAAVLGNRVTVNCYLDVFIGRRTLIADDVYIIDFDHRIADLDEAIMDQGIIKAPVRIGSGCWLGTKAVVTRGVTIGEGAVVGAGAIVTRDVPDNAIVAGVPARVIGDRAAIGGDLSRLRKPHFGAQAVVGGVVQRDAALMGIHEFGHNRQT